jgi:hypothetical protein
MGAAASSRLRGGFVPLRLNAQWGVEFDCDADPSPLVFPFVAQWTHLGTFLVVDRCQPENRIVELDPDGSVVWAVTRPMRTNFAHRIDDDIVLYCRDVNLE